MKNLIINNNISIKDALKLMNKTGEKCLVVADDNDLLLGTLSDGDLRKAILKGAVVSNTIKDIYQEKPIVLLKGNYNSKEVKKIFLDNKFALIPVVENIFP